jgi:hypothetical protein
MALLETAGYASRTRTRSGEDLARRTLRGQIARLERRLAAAGRPLPPPGRRGSPRLLDFEAMERVRDDLAQRAAAAESAAAAQGAAESAARARLEAMLADPAAHPWAIVRREELGLPGCGDYHVRPRAGLLGLLFGWWRVKLSSGCPLAMAHYRDRPAHLRPNNPLLELVVTILVLTVLVATVIVFLFVYHDFPLRVS